MGFQTTLTDAELVRTAALVARLSVDGAAKDLGVQRSTVMYRLRQFKRRGLVLPGGCAPVSGYVRRRAERLKADVEMLRTLNPAKPPVVPAGFVVASASARYDAEGEIEGYGVQAKSEGADPAELAQVPDPKKITRTTTLYDRSGGAVLQWVQEKPEDKAREALWREFAAALADDLPKAAAEAAPAYVDEDILVAYPVGDHHIGMLSWEDETGASYDLRIAESLAVQAIDHLVGVAPPGGVALLPILGDWVHYDSTVPETPTNKNHLDADGRYQKMIRVAIRTARYLVRACLRKHAQVHVIVETGNHDPYTSKALAEFLAILYEDEPRVSVDTKPGCFHYYQFGKVLIGTHHGDGAKMADLPLIMANDMREAWGSSVHRYWWTGHVHHLQAKDFTGCLVESFRVLPPGDAWHVSKGYRALRDMKSIILHREHGEVARNTVNPSMFLRKG